MYLLDTGILIGYGRGAEYFQYVKSEFFDKNPQRELITSLVNVAELRAFAQKNSWGNRKLSKVEEYLAEYVRILEINEELIEHYANIDAFAESDKHPTEQRPRNVTARIMGKNDLWIAATAFSVKLATGQEVEILGTDKDFSTIMTLVKSHYISPDTNIHGEIVKPELKESMTNKKKKKTE